ncbi:unnamed protein product [Strongylus vulgaris]|uniref:Uncharacterized protein n=1 Tax=Strongylus vulgaris TaxID=40348 RepID=A0A3P7IZR2_STRVU|nr:unnamed protein product [Strongylus vulgaris]
MQIETLTSHDELERRVKMAQEISAKLEQLPDVVKSVLDEFRTKLDAAMNHFMNTTMIYDGTGLNPFDGEIVNIDQNLEGESNGAANSGEVGGPANCENMVDGTSARCEDVRDVPRALSLLERRTRQLRAMQQQCSALRRRRLHGRLSRDVHSFGEERARLERLRDELRNDLYETEDQDVETREARRNRILNSLRSPIPPSRPASTVTTPSRPHGDERARSNSIEIIATPPAVADLEQRAGRWRLAEVLIDRYSKLF